MDGNLHKQIFRPSACVSQGELRQYLDGTMSKEGLRRVEDHLLDCPLCSDAVDGFEESGGHMTDDLEDFDSFREKLPSSTTATIRQLEPRRGFVRQAVAIAAVLVVGAVAYFSFSKSSTPTGPELFAKYHRTYENDIPVTLRRPGISDVDPNFAMALTSYSEHKYSQANMLFERALVSQPDNEATLFFAGMSYLEANQVGKASGYLAKVADGTGVYAKKAAWYLIMCDLKSGNVEEAKSRLDQFLQTSDIMVSEAKSLRKQL